MKSKQYCIICDIDGVYLDSREWHQFVPKKHDDRKGWDEFAKHVDVCKPNKEIIELLKNLNLFFPIIFLTSREATEFLANKTKEQIESFSNKKIKIGARNKLLMRDKNDYRSSEEVKREILDKEVLPSFEPLLAIDDEEGNVKMFRSKGITTEHYAKLRGTNDHKQRIKNSSITKE